MCRQTQELAISLFLGMFSLRILRKTRRKRLCLALSIWVEHVISEKHQRHQGTRYLRSRCRRQAARQDLRRFLATDPDKQPTDVLAALAALGFTNTYSSGYTHKDRGKVLDLHFQKDGTDLFKGWKTEECEANLAAINSLFSGIGVTITPRVMTLAEAYA